MPRLQTGRLYEASGAFYVQYYQHGKRVSKRLCAKDDKHHSLTCKPVKLLRDEFMLKVNTKPDSVGRQTKVADFWRTVYLPWAEGDPEKGEKGELRVSTAKGYKKIWEQVLRDHFANQTLEEYQTVHGSQLLTKLSRKYGKRTVQHVRSLASGIFTLAVNHGLLERNPWREVKSLIKAKEPAEAPHYTLQEVERLLAALKGQLREQVIISVSFFLGLRPSEIAGLRWEDVSEDSIYIRHSVVGGIVGPTKTSESAATLPLIQPVKGLLEIWRAKVGGPASGWVFENRKAAPIDLHNVANRVIIPAIEKWNQKHASKQVEWKGLYAGRRGAGTILVDLTGNLVAAQELLRHKSLTTTALHYKKKTQNSLVNGMRLLEREVGK